MQMNETVWKFCSNAKFYQYVLQRKKGVKTVHRLQQNPQWRQRCIGQCQGRQSTSTDVRLTSNRVTSPTIFNPFNDANFVVKKSHRTHPTQPLPSVHNLRCATSTYLSVSRLRSPRGDCVCQLMVFTFFFFIISLFRFPFFDSLWKTRWFVKVCVLFNREWRMSFSPRTF